MSVVGTSLPSRDVRYLVAIGGKADIQNRREWPISDIDRNVAEMALPIVSVQRAPCTKAS